MANHVLTVLAFTGTTADLDRLKAALFVEDEGTWRLSCSQLPVATTVGAVTRFDRSGSAWDPRWVDNAPHAAIVSFWTTWQPNLAVLNAVGALAVEHNVAVLHGAAIEESFHGAVPQVWEGGGLQMAPVAKPTPRAAHLVASCGHPVRGHHLSVLDRGLRALGDRLAA